MNRAFLLTAAGLLHLSFSVPLPSLPLINAVNVSIPRLLLGTGGGAGGYDASAWLSLTSSIYSGFDSAQTYCYNPNPPFCSHTAIYNALTAAQVAPSSVFIISKVEPEDFGVLSVMSGFGRVVDRGILQDMSLKSIDMIMAHQAGRSSGASNVRPVCFNASLAGPAGPGTYSTCRVQMMQTFLQLQKAGLVRSFAVSNWIVSDMQFVKAATGVFPSALEMEVHPYWHEDDLIAFCQANGIVIINYAPVALASKALFAEPAVLATAVAHDATPAQVVLQWGLQKTGGVIIPRSANATHMAENLAVAYGAFSLTAAEMAAMDSYPQKKIYNVYCFPWC